jgi:hypothetical protein
VPEPHLGYSTAFGSKFAVIPGGCPTNTLSRTFHGSEIGSITGRAACWITLETGASAKNDIGHVKIITDNTVLFEWSVLQDSFTSWENFTYDFEECKTYTLEMSNTNSVNCQSDSLILIDFQVDEANNNIDCDSGSNGDPHRK